MLWRLVCLLALSSGLFATGAEAGPRPNIILVIGDDHGWPYYGFQESPHILSNGLNVQGVVQTPNLDSLAASGVTFTRGYATDSVCTPSLQTLLSAHGHEWAQWVLLREQVAATMGLDEDALRERRENRYADNLPRTLGRHGYRTWEGGKMWAGLLADTGFQEGLASFLHPAPFFGSGGWGFGRDGWNVADCGSTASGTTPCPALDPFRAFLDGVDGEPFFAWFAPMLPHTPYDAPQEYREDFAALGLESFEVDHLSNIRWFDELLGELLSELEARGLRSDTLLIYASDNGWGMGFQTFGGSGRGKGTLYDLGFRTPILFNQPGTVPAGVRYDDFVSFSDLPATILDYADSEIPEGSMGQSLRSRVHGGPPLARDGLVVFSRTEGGAYVDRQWRYLQFDDGREELYRIDTDPFEQEDLASANPFEVERFAEIVNARRASLVQFREEATVRGQLRDVADAPIGGAHIRLVGGAHRISVLTGEDGRFRFPALPASQELRLRASKGLKPLLLDAATLLPVLRPLTLAGLFLPIRGTAGRTVEGALGGVITGRVRTPSGVPIDGAQVRARVSLPGRDVSLTTISQADGRYVFENLVAAEGYVLKARARHHRPAKRTGIEVPSPTDRLDIELVLEPR